MFHHTIELSEQDKEQIVIEFLKTMTWNHNQRMAELKSEMDNFKKQSLMEAETTLKNLLEQKLSIFNAECEKILKEQSLPIEEQLNDLKEYKEQYSIVVKDMSIVVEYIQAMDKLWHESLQVVLNSLTISKQDKQSLVNELKALKEDLTKTKGEEYNRTLKKYMELKNKLEV